MILLLLGITLLFSNLGKIEALHGSAVVSLIAVGILFGGAILGLLGRLYDFGLSMSAAL
jgi:hypothetical protein